MLLNLTVMIMGRSRVISTSKIKKIIAIKKKCKEKGSREDDFGSNPHSNGDLFSRSEMVFFEVKFNTIISTVLIRKITRAIIISKWIIYTIL